MARFLCQRWRGRQKKLIDAAVWLVKRPPDEPPIIAEYVAMGATPAQIAKLRRKIAAEIEKDRPVILPENQTAYQAFLSINDQLIIAPMGGVVGLNLLAVDVVLRRLNIELSAEDFEKLLLLGREYVKAINKEIK